MKEVSLETIQNGAVVDMFNEELQKVMENIADENTKPDAVRSITITVSIKPDKTRRSAATAIECKSRICPVKPSDGFIFLNQTKDGSLEAFEDDYRQKELEDADGVSIYTMPKAEARS